jgi:hypothetical protein
LEEKIFLYYFKFDSLDPAVQKYINESSAEPEMDALLKRFKLGKYEKQTISTEECKLVTLSEQAILDNFLSQNLIEINAKNKEGDTLLTWAIAKGDVELTKKLIATGKFIISEKEIALAKQKPEIMRVLRPTVHLSPSAVYLFMISAQNARWFNFEYLNKWSDQTQLKSRSETIPQDIALAVKVPESSISEIKFYGRYGYSFTTTPGTVSALREFEAKHQQHNPIKDEITKIFTLCQSLESKAITDELIKLGKDIQSIKDSPSGIDFLARLQDVLKKDTSPGSQEKLKPVAEKTAGLLNSLLKLQKNLTNGAFAFSL